MSKKRKMTEEEYVSPLVVSFQNKVAKELFVTILEEYSSDITTLIASLAISKQYGSTEPFIDVVGDEVTVGTLQADKGIVIAKGGFVNYTDIPVGEKYAQVTKIGNRTGLAVFAKSGEGNADVAIGLAPSVKEVFDEVNKEGVLDVETVKPVESK